MNIAGTSPIRSGDIVRCVAPTTDLKDKAAYMVLHSRPRELFNYWDMLVVQDLSTGELKSLHGHFAWRFELAE